MFTEIELGSLTVRALVNVMIGQTLRAVDTLITFFLAIVFKMIQIVTTLPGIWLI